MKFVGKAKLPVALGVISISCPFVVAIIIILVHLSNSEFLTSVSSAPEDDANRHAAVLMGAAEGMAFIFAFIGCVFGLLVGAVGFLLQGRTRNIGFVGLILNAAPLLFFLYFM